MSNGKKGAIGSGPSKNTSTVDNKKAQAEQLAKAKLAEVEKRLQANIQHNIKIMNPVRLAVFQAKYRAKLRPGSWDDSLNDAFCKEVLGIDPKKMGKKLITRYIGSLQRNFKEDLKKYGVDGKFGVESLNGFFKFYLKSKVLESNKAMVRRLVSGKLKVNMNEISKQINTPRNYKEYFANPKVMDQIGKLVGLQGKGLEKAIQDIYKFRFAVWDTEDLKDGQKLTLGDLTGYLLHYIQDPNKFKVEKPEMKKIEWGKIENDSAVDKVLAIIKKVADPKYPEYVRHKIAILRTALKNPAVLKSHGVVRKVIELAEGNLAVVDDVLSKLSGKQALGLLYKFAKKADFVSRGDKYVKAILEGMKARGIDIANTITDTLEAAVVQVDEIKFVKGLVGLLPTAQQKTLNNFLVTIENYAARIDWEKLRTSKDLNFIAREIEKVTNTRYTQYVQNKIKVLRTVIENEYLADSDSGLDLILTTLNISDANLELVRRVVSNLDEEKLKKLALKAVKRFAKGKSKQLKKRLLAEIKKRGIDTSVATKAEEVMDAIEVTQEVYDELKPFYKKGKQLADILGVDVSDLP